MVKLNSSLSERQTIEAVEAEGRYATMLYINTASYDCALCVCDHVREEGRYAA